MSVVRGLVLVGGWPASGKSTLSAALARHWDVPWLSKDELKEGLMAGLGEPADVEASRAMGVAAVHALLRVAASCPAAVVDSTWYPYTRPLLDALPGPLVEVRCRVTLDLARERYAARSRAAGHLEGRRTEEELWGREVAPLGVGPLVEVDTSSPVDVPALAQRLATLLTARRS